MLIFFYKNKLNFVYQAKIGTVQDANLTKLGEILWQYTSWTQQILKDDTKVLNKMINELTTGTWQDNIGCPVNINLGSTSDGT